VTWPRDYGTGVTFTNLFRDWPTDRLATVHCDPVPTTDDVCTNYFVLGPDEIRRRWPFHALAQAAVLHPGDAGRAGNVPVGPALARRIKQRVFGDGLPETANLSPALGRFIDEFRPQVLYTILGGNGLVDLVELIRARWNLPLVVHVMDDWRGTIYGQGWFSGWQRARLNRNIARLIRLASARFGICDAMAEVFARDYGVPFTAFQNTVDTRRWLPLAREACGTASPPRLLYSGSLLPYAQTEAVVEAAEAVAALAGEGWPIRFDIHCPPAQADAYRARLALGPAVRLLPPFERWDAFFANLVAADALLLPVNFDPVTVQYIRYSMPTKVPEYLMSGTPVLVYGPPGVAQVDYARREGWGEVVARRDPAALRDGLRRVLQDRGLRERLSARAKALAADRHDAATVRAAFRRTLAGAMTMRPAA